MAVVNYNCFISSKQTLKSNLGGIIPSSKSFKNNIFQEKLTRRHLTGSKKRKHAVPTGRWIVELQVFFY